jgi:hypothetical protein
VVVLDGANDRLGDPFGLQDETAAYTSPQVLD